MNKRIDDLIAQATYVSESDDPDYRYESFDKKKFAELIVQDCIDIISPYTVRMGRPGEEYLHPILEIKRNFGVE
jgi:hypothetical protein